MQKNTFLLNKKSVFIFIHCKIRMFNYTDRVMQLYYTILCHKPFQDDE